MILPSIIVHVSKEVFQNRFELFVSDFEGLHGYRVELVPKMVRNQQMFQINLSSQMDHEPLSSRINTGEIMMIPLDEQKMELRASLTFSNSIKVSRVFFDSLYMMIRDRWKLVWDNRHNTYEIMTNMGLLRSPVTATLLCLSTKFDKSIVALSAEAIKIPTKHKIANSEVNANFEVNLFSEEEIESFLDEFQMTTLEGKLQEYLSFGLDDFGRDIGERLIHHAGEENGASYITKPYTPTKPALGAPLDQWFDFYHKRKKSGVKYTLADLAEDAKQSSGHIRNVHGEYKNRHNIS